MTFSTLAKQVARIEEKINAKPGGSVSLWLAGLLKSPDENEVTLNAASLLIFESVLDLPDAHVWERLSERLNSNSEHWPDARLWFLGAALELDSPNFEDEEGREAACYLARVYFELYQEAPPPRAPAPHVRAWCKDRLGLKFIRPLLARACPELDAYSTATHTTWLKKMLDAPQSQELDSALASLQEYVHAIGAKA